MAGNEMKTKEKPWGGRFSEPTDREVENFTASLHFDRRLYRYDIEGSIAHARMLARQGILAKGEERMILKGLKEILAEIEAGTFLFSADDEDIHMAIEKALIGRIGDAGGKLHAGRSRNDQIALDLRLYLRDEIGRILELVGSLKAGFVELAKKELKTVFPGYTHLQKAQPVLLSHYLLAFSGRPRSRGRGFTSTAASSPVSSASRQSPPTVWTPFPTGTSSRNSSSPRRWS